MSTTDHPRSGMRGVRIREGGFEGQCGYCEEFHPLSEEFWTMGPGGLRRCKACWAEYKRLKEAGYKAAKRDIFNAAVRARMAMMSPEEKEMRLQANRRWKAANRAHIAAYNREYRLRKSA